MALSGPLAHIDLSVGYAERSIPFYAVFLESLGYRRAAAASAEGSDRPPSRATWRLERADGTRFEIELRPARLESRDRPYDRYEPGPHHLAFHADSRATVERVYEAMRAIGATILDPPTDYGGEPSYEDGYYAVFVADPDGLKLEVAHIPSANP